MTNLVISVIPPEEWKQFNDNQKKILDLLSNLSIKTDVSSPYITANEFMDIVRIRRPKFDKLVATKMIETLKKGRKIYVKSSEVSRYFNDLSME